MSLHLAPSILQYSPHPPPLCLVMGDLSFASQPFFLDMIEVLWGFIICLSICFSVLVFLASLIVRFFFGFTVFGPLYIPLMYGYGSSDLDAALVLVSFGHSCSTFKPSWVRSVCVCLNDRNRFILWNQHHPVRLSRIHLCVCVNVFIMSTPISTNIMYTLQWNACVCFELHPPLGEGDVSLHQQWCIVGDSI